MRSCGPKGHLGPEGDMGTEGQGCRTVTCKVQRVTREVRQRLEDGGSSNVEQRELEETEVEQHRSQASPELRLDMSECPEGRELEGSHQGTQRMSEGINEGSFKSIFKLGL